MTMKEKVIAHWKDILDKLCAADKIISCGNKKAELSSGLIAWGEDDCAYCKKYREDDCVGCPIASKTMQSICDGTPWYEFSMAMWHRNLPKARKQAGEMLKFLESLPEDDHDKA